MCIIDSVKMNDECSQYKYVIYLETNTGIAGAIHPRHPRRLQTPRRKSPHISMDWQAKHLGISKKGPTPKKRRAWLRLEFTWQLI